MKPKVIILILKKLNKGDIMKTKKVLCYYCHQHKATLIDYRDFNGCVGRYLSCKYCKWLNNKTIREIQEKRLDPKQFFTKEKEND